MLPRRIAILALLLAAGFSAPAVAQNTTPAAIDKTPPQLGDVRIKELTAIDGLTPVTVGAPGLIVGLNGTGDSESMLTQLLVKYDIPLPTELKAGGTAIVWVSATIEPFMTFGDTVEISVSVLGDAKSLENGRLISVPLLSPSQTGIENKDAYVMAQGPVALATDANSPVNGLIHQGGQIIRDLQSFFHTDSDFVLVLHNADFQTAQNIIRAINDNAPRLLSLDPNSVEVSAEILKGYPIAEPMDAKRVRIKIPAIYKRDLVSFISRIQQIEVAADVEAVVTINLKTNTLCFTGDVVILPTTIMYKGVTISTTPKPAVAGQIGSVQGVRQPGTTLTALTADLNAAGWTAEEMVAITLALHRSGAIKAKVVVQ